MYIPYHNIHNSAELISLIEELGFLPLLRMGIGGWSAEEQVNRNCLYTKLPDGSWEWPLWEWKGPIIQETGCAYGKFFLGKAGFISKDLWPDFCNWRRSRYPLTDQDSIEAMILDILREEGSLITRDLRAACGFTGSKMRGKFDTYLSHLEKGCYILTSDFVYPRGKHGNPYGWGWSLLTTPEARFGREAYRAVCPPEESYSRLMAHFHRIMPQADELFFQYLLG